MHKTMALCMLKSGLRIMRVLFHYIFEKIFNTPKYKKKSVIKAVPSLIYFFIIIPVHLTVQVL